MVGKFKFNNKPTEIDGIRFPSKKEAKRYTELTMMQKGGAIRDLQMQVTYQLIGSQKGEHRKELPLKYIADFVYTNRDGTQIVEDVKGVRSKDYVMKRKLMLMVHGISIFET